MPVRHIKVRGAREHNLKGIDVDIPRERLTVITGISGSGKSSLAFDTVYAEGNRRYVESLSSSARQFLEQVAKPDVEMIEGLPPTIAVSQRPHRAGPRSTVATTTELYDFLRLLYARLGKPHCPTCGRPIMHATATEIVDSAMALSGGTRVIVLSPRVRKIRGNHSQLIDQIKREGYVRIRVDGILMELRDVKPLPPKSPHTIEVVVDRLAVKKGIRPRLADSVELALRTGNGSLVLAVERDGVWNDTPYSTHYSCPECDFHFPELSPRVFSFNNPYGACQDCDGLGTQLELDFDLIIPEPRLPLADGAILPFRRGSKKVSDPKMALLEKFAKAYDISLFAPFADMPDDARDALLNGGEKDDFSYEGLVHELGKRFFSSQSEKVKSQALRWMSAKPCPTCGGARIKPELLSVIIAEKNIHEITKFDIGSARRFFKKLKFEGTEAEIAKPIMREILGRLGFIEEIGLSYLTLDRNSSTLSGGEFQRIHLATQIGSGLVGVCYILDEPTVGLHVKDNRQLLDALTRLRNIGNTVIVVEHDEQTIRMADHLIDMGPGAGAQGGEVVARGTPSEVESTDTLTGMYLSRELEIPIPRRRRALQHEEAVRLQGARENNLQNIDVTIPLGGLVCITGVSGSGKSTLVTQTLIRALHRQMYGTGEKPGAYSRIEGGRFLDRIVEIDQSPIGRTPRSNPATYTGLFKHIRNIFAKTREAKVRGYSPARFSFNVKGGRCEACQGQGTKRIEMHFLPDVYVRCDKCDGTRFSRETLEVTYRGLNIADVLKLKVVEALDLFKNIPHAVPILQTLKDVGLGYLELGQPASTLSGGEAQRVKIATELAKVKTRDTLYVLDEPTTGLHFADISMLLAVFDRLIGAGNSIIVIEHNFDVIKTADWIIDLGPEGGEKGGAIVATGTPEDVASNKKSFTGQALRRVLG
ncbi:MAG: excinuclease ABC subunit UvrA [Planctomycetota bacterium]|nr:MAG: excinuclease ABC subunit UvrA [Planctomycetota bacterium]